MATITSTGLGSGLDIEGLVSKLVAAERDPVAADLKKKNTKITNKISALGKVSAALSVFQTAARALESTGQYVTPSASSSDTASLTASASTAAQLTTHTIAINQLAQSQRISSSRYATADAVVGTGSLTIRFGRLTQLDGTTLATADGNGNYNPATTLFNVNASKNAVTINIGAQNNTLSGIRDAINASGAPVTASILNDGTGFRLVLTSNDTGESNALQITASDSDGNNTDATGLSALSYDVTRASGAGQNMSELQAAANARLTVDGLQVTSQSNTASNILTGLTLNLQKTTSSPVTLTVGRDAASASKALDAFAKAYNDLRKTIREVSFYDASTKTAGPLQGETVVRGLEAQLRSVLTSSVSTSSFSRLTDIGISFDKNGLMTYDSSKFTAAMSRDAASVAALMGSYGVSSDSQLSFLSATSALQPGRYAVNVTQAATQGSLRAGTGVTGSIDLTGGTNTFALTVDGVSSGTITLTSRVYNTSAELAQELQTRINGDSALAAAGASVHVAFDDVTGKLQIVSNRYGSRSNVSLNVIDPGLSTALGLSGSNTITAGLDVAGTIAGFAATGDGQKLTGNGPASGLTVQVSGTATGDRGVITFSRGLAVQLTDTISSMLSSKGIITGRQNALADSIGDLTKQAERLDVRMKSLEQRYRTQFTNLDKTVSMLRNTSSYLQQQLASLTASSSSR
jgi:flagellar hook-associated protein 2